MKARLFGSFVAGLLFALGLAIAGMTLPSKVIGFLDVTGAWDPSLAFVMLGAVGVFGPLYASIERKKIRTLVVLRIPPPGARDVPLVAGAVLFGLGWGVSGFCPGPGVVAAATGAAPAVAFALSMLAGMGAYRVYQGLSGTRGPESVSPHSRG